MNRTAFITGGSRGIGRAIVVKLAEQGYKVVFTYRSKQKASESLVRDLTARGFHVIAFQMALEDRENIRSALNHAREAFCQPISILVNNAAIAQEKPFQTITDEDWSHMLMTNLQGPFRCIQECLDDMLSQKWGRIINISSIGGQWGGVNQVHYAASKAGLINLSHSMAKLYSANGICSNSVAVGLVATDMSMKELNRKDGKKKLGNIPIGRIADAEEIASSVAFLCSNDSSYVTGQTLNLNGAMLMS